MGNARDDYEEKLRRLRLEYQKLLPLRVKEIERVWQELREDGNGGAGLRKMFRLVHSLSGSGKTFGFSQLSREAGEIEAYLNRILDGEKIDEAERDQIMEAHLEKLTAAMTNRDSVEPQPEDWSQEPTPASMGQVVYWYGIDAELASRVKSQFYYFGFDIHVFDQLTALTARLAQRAPSLLVLDTYLAQQEAPGEAAVAEIIKQVGNPVPVICLCPRGQDAGIWLTAIRAGATKCFGKPIQPFELLDHMDELTFRVKEDPSRILMIDDDEHLVEHTSSILSKAGMKVEGVTNPLKALERVNHFQPDLILMDLYMPQCSGLELAQLIRQEPRFLTIPIVYLSRETEINQRLAAFASGAEDFIFKPFKFRYLFHTLTSRIKRARQLRAYLTHDGLTGRLNRTALHERLLQEMEIAYQKKSELVFGLVGIDGLKTINQNHGHPVGDRVLKALALFLKRRLGPHAVAGRHGGGEFAVILPGALLSQVRGLLNHLRKHFAKIVFTSERGVFHATLSCGLAHYPTYKSAGQLTEAGGVALSRAQSEGGNQALYLKPDEAQPNKEDPLKDEWLVLVEDDQEVMPSPTPLSKKVKRQPPEDDRASPPSSVKGDGASLVVVDDDEMVLKQTTLMLESLGYCVFPASTGDEGFELVKQHHPQILLTDLLLFPGIHGFELCERIRHDPDLDHVKIMLMTAVYKDYRYRIEGKDAGSDDFIEKPLDYEELADKIARLSAAPAPTETITEVSS